MLAKMNNVPKLFVGNKQKFNVSMFWNKCSDFVLDGLSLLFSCAMLNVNRELHHFKTKIEQGVSKACGFCTLRFGCDRQIK